MKRAVQLNITRHRWPVTVLLVLSVILLFFRLGDGYLWQDEAETALVSQTILTYGVPKGHDGLNSFSQHQGKDLGENNLWRWHPWFPFYITALSQAVFNDPTFSARFPAALAGLGTVLLLYWLSWQMFHSRRAALFSALFMLLCVAFLLLATQARYYSFSMFFTLSSMLGFLYVIKNRPYGLWIFGLSLFLLLHTHYVYAILIMVTISVYTFSYENHLLKKILLAGGGVILINIPVLLWHAGISGVYERDFYDVSLAGSYLISFLTKMHSNLMNGILFIVILILSISAILKPKKKSGIKQSKNGMHAYQLLWLPVGFSILTLITFAIIGEGGYFRYLAPAIPAFFIVIGWLFEHVFRYNKFLAGVVFIVWLYLGDMDKYIKKLMHDYQGPMEGIVAALNEVAQPGDTVAIAYGDLPVKYYTKDLYVIGALAEESFESSARAKWIIIRNHNITERDAAMNLYLAENFDQNRYRVAEIKFPDSPFQNREEPGLHYFVTPKGMPHVRILRRTDP